MKTALVFGAGGFLGRHLVFKLGILGWSACRYNLRGVGGDATLRVSGPSGIAQAIQSADVVYNLAAVSSPAACELNHSEAGFVNRVIPGVIARECAVARKRLIHIGTSASESRTASVYALTKTRGEEAALEYGATSLRIFNVYGAGMQSQQAISAIVRKLRAGDPELFGCDPNKTFRDFIHVDDVVDMLTSAMLDENFAPAKSIVQAGTGIATSIMDVAKYCSEHTGIPLGNYKPPPYKPGAPDVSVCTGMRFKWKVGLDEGIGRYVKESAIDAALNEDPPRVD